MFNCNRIAPHRPHTWPAHSIDGYTDGTPLHCAGLTRQDVRDIMGDPCNCADLDCPCDGGVLKPGHHTDRSVQVGLTAHDVQEGPW